MSRKGAGTKGKYRSITSGKYVSAYYGKRNPAMVRKEEAKPGAKEGVQGVQEGREARSEAQEGP